MVETLLLPPTHLYHLPTTKCNIYTLACTLLSSESSAPGGAEWVVKSVTKGRQLGSPERIREKFEVKTLGLASERENVRKAESKISELEEKVESAETRARAAAAIAAHLEQQLQYTQQLLYYKVMTTESGMQ